MVTSIIVCALLVTVFGTPIYAFDRRVVHPPGGSPPRFQRTYPVQSAAALPRPQLTYPAQRYPIFRGLPYPFPPKYPAKFIPIPAHYAPVYATPSILKYPAVATSTPSPYAVISSTNRTVSTKKEKKIIVAHRGASGYLPEHTMASKVLAFQMGADYIEQDVLMTKDNYLVVVHGLHLDTTTNVRDIFPGRNRADGKYYVIDFTLEEIKRLRSTVNFGVDKDGNFLQKYPNRFPLWTSDFGIHTFEEEIELIQGLNKVLSKNVGIMPEIKRPWFHRMEGRDITTHVLRVLKSYGYSRKDSKCYLQVYDPNELKKIHDQIQPQLGMDLKLVQLMAFTYENTTYEFIDGEWRVYNYDWMFEHGAMERIATYADAVGAWYPMIMDDNREMSPLVENAHKNKLKVMAYTFRSDQGKLPPYAKNFEDMLDIFFNDAKIDGIFTDFPDKGVKWRDNN